MKNIVFIILLFSITVFSQKNSGQITYKVTKEAIDIPEKIKGNKVSLKMKTMVTTFFNDKREIVYILKFNKEESVFFKSNKMNISTKKKSVIEILVGNGKFYTNLQSKKILNQKQALGELFLVDQNLFDWKLLQERKKIGKYLCYKAVGRKIVRNSKGSFIKPVIAWYTTEIPVSFGPKEFSGLPGLILELQEGKLKFKVDRIELNPKKEISIKKPTKGKKLNIIEYELLTESIFDNQLRKKIKGKTN